MMKKVIYGAVCIVLAFIGVLLAVNFLGPLLVDQPKYIYYGAIALIGIIMAALGVLLAPRLGKVFEKNTEKIVAGFSAMSTAELISRIIGLITGLVIASLMSVFFARIDIVGPYIAIVFALLLVYLGWRVGGKIGTDGIHFRSREPHPAAPRPSSARRSRSAETAEKKWQCPPKILDTSVIIDGRIADIYRTGFLEGELVIANFVLEELRHIADSSDNLKRNRGRSGLDTLNRLREQFSANITISEQDYPKLAEVDSKLLRLAQEMNGVVVTNDFNLNKVARLQGMTVLNINELANAVKPIVLPGEEMSALVIKEGKEANQGVAYLDDGTMIVVENGVRYVGMQIFVIVTSILQTAAGRMIFARPKLDKKGQVIEIKNEYHRQ